MWQQRRVGGYNDDDRAQLRIRGGAPALVLASARDAPIVRRIDHAARQQVGDVAPHRGPGHAKARAAAVVALHEHADRERAGIREMPPLNW